LSDLLLRMTLETESFENTSALARSRKQQARELANTYLIPATWLIGDKSNEFNKLVRAMVEQESFLDVSIPAVVHSIALRAWETVFEEPSNNHEQIPQ